MHMDISQDPFCVEIYRENAARVAHGHRFVRACAVEMYMDISQEPFCTEFRGKMPDAPDTTAIEHRALTVTVRTPLSVATLFGEKKVCHKGICWPCWFTYVYTHTYI